MQPPSLRFNILLLLIFLAAFSRAIPHMANFSPLGAIGLFAAAYFTKKWQVFLVPLAATWLSDLFINNVVYAQYYPQFTWFYNGFYWQYGSYVLITLVGLFVLQKVTISRIVIAALCSSAIFFLVTNFSYWATDTYYAHTLEGLVACYKGGLPYLKGTVYGDLFYCGLLFGIFELLQRRFPALRKPVAPVHM